MGDDKLLKHQVETFSALMSSLKSIVVEGSDEQGNVDMAGETGVRINGAISERLTTLINMRGKKGAEVIQGYMESEKGGEDERELNGMLISYVIDFLELFVSSAADRSDANKALMSELVKIVTGRVKGVEGAYVEGDGKVTEEDVDKWMDENAKRFDGGFIRYLDSEVHRVTSSPNQSQPVIKTGSILKIVRVRVLEEVGKRMGEEIEVMNQVLGYDKDGIRERVVLAGLEARGRDMAERLKAVCEEVLEGEVKGEEGEEEFRRRVGNVLETVKGWENIKGEEEGEWE
ncbi:hypothetical protein TrRE_jg11399 [Triparma retinervis]|uniref:Uncharacterized protein n=1 Tax=Triparma retinervis TaxID=2557542 RepID=A0A9W6ZFY8_9STRA|nr:hypothetical protein TrRE_jg11399 [Triparma retinervis]